MRILTAILSLLISSSSNMLSSPKYYGCYAFNVVPKIVNRIQSTRMFSETLSSSSSTVGGDIVPLVKNERIILNTIPTVYVYDHCPFCVRVRVALGVKNVKHNIHFLANDDKITPTALVGKKIAPIFQWSDENTNDDICMPESMDIIRYVDNDERFGPTGLIHPASSRTDINAWQSSVRELLRGLQRPRYVATGLLPEFQQLDGRHAFIMNHQMAPYGKDEWKKELAPEEKLKIYAEAMAKDPASDIEELNRKLIELDDIIHCEYHCSPTSGLSYDDIDLFSRLRSVTIIKDVDWPIKLRSYMDNMSELSDVPLYDEMAL
jgi:glutaredoxin 2